MEKDHLVPILDASSKQIYQLFLRKKQTPPIVKQKLTNKYPNTAINWQKVCSLAFQTPLDSKIREFQYKILNCIVFTNEKLCRFGLVESPISTFCQELAESVEHLLFSCKISSDFWKHVLSWLRDNNVFVGTIDESDLIPGKFDIVNDFIFINHILLSGKYYIHSRRCLNSVPTLKGFIARTAPYGQGEKQAPCAFSKVGEVNQRINTIIIWIALTNKTLNLFNLLNSSAVLCLFVRLFFWFCFHLYLFFSYSVIYFMFSSTPYCYCL